MSFAPGRVVDELRTHPPGDVNALTAGGPAVVAIHVRTAPVIGPSAADEPPTTGFGRGRCATSRSDAQHLGGSNRARPGHGVLLQLEVVRAALEEVARTTDRPDIPEQRPTS